MKSKPVTTTEEFAVTVLYEKVRGGYQVTAPSLPGVVTFGRTFEEARDMAHEAIACHLEGLRKDKQTLHPSRSFIHEEMLVAV
ncbi:MAG: type II toxin-antitoxin system HicB family antitoxin [Patescibacteria group bacterium]|jgi:predicted RNase H-like HicB family nuclease